MNFEIYSAKGHCVHLDFELKSSHEPLSTSI